MAGRPPRDQQARDHPPRAVRLTFAFGPEGIELIDRQVIEKRVPPPDDLPAELDATTIAAEIRSRAGASVFRRVIPQALPVDVEVFDPDGTAHRDPTPPARGVFTVLVPEADADEEAEVVLLARAEEAPDLGPAPRRKSAQEGGPPVERARFPIRREDKLGNG